MWGIPLTQSRKDAKEKREILAPILAKSAIRNP
jgi:hypothetical protein